MFVTDNGFTFVFVKHLKQSEPKYHNPQLKIVPFEDSSLCVQLFQFESGILRELSLLGEASQGFR